MSIILYLTKAFSIDLTIAAPVGPIGILYNKKP